MCRQQMAVGAPSRHRVVFPPAVYDGCWMFDDNEEEELDEGQHLGAGAKPQFCTVGRDLRVLRCCGAFTLLM